jgi:hypothetical protein
MYPQESKSIKIHTKIVELKPPSKNKYIHILVLHLKWCPYPVCPGIVESCALGSFEAMSKGLYEFSIFYPLNFLGSQLYINM